MAPATGTSRGIRLQVAAKRDAVAIAAMRNVVNQHLAAASGHPEWAPTTSDKWIRWSMREGRVYMVRRAGKIIATLTLKPKKPWSIDRSFLTPVKRHLYLIDMAVAPAFQRKGLGRRCIAAAINIARQWPADSLALDADDSPSGAGPFYKKCGFTQLGRGKFRSHRLIYFEYLLSTR